MSDIAEQIVDEIKALRKDMEVRSAQFDHLGDPRKVRAHVVGMLMQFQMSDMPTMLGKARQISKFIEDGSVPPQAVS